MGKTRTIARIALSTAATIIALTVLASCQGERIAATVNGESIPEAQITERIQSFRDSNDLAEDSAWAQWLVDSGRTPADMRDDEIDHQIDWLLVEQAARKAGISVTEQEIDQEIAELKDLYDANDEQFAELIEGMGYTDESYRALQRNALLEEKLADSMDGEAKAFGEFLDRLKQSAEITRNDMPSGLPYDVAPAP